jgi:hypothetical protein
MPKFIVYLDVHPELMPDAGYGEYRETDPIKAKAIVMAKLEARLQSALGRTWPWAPMESAKITAVIPDNRREPTSSETDG